MTSMRTRSFTRVTGARLFAAAILCAALTATGLTFGIAVAEPTISENCALLPVERGCPGGAEGMETSSELPSSLANIAQRLGMDSVHTLSAAIEQKARMAATVTPPAGASNVWQPVGKTPLLANDPRYDVYGAGLGRLAGRISDLFYDEDHDRILAAVASGGVWESKDLGRSWHSIGDSLPIQQTGSVAYTPAGGGTIIAISGDNAFGGYTFAGVGAFWTTDDGKTWHKSVGIPDGAMGFKVAVDKGKPNVIYSATGFGLYRSTDAGRTFQNLNLPTGNCAGNSLKDGCFLANIVTDVVVQSKDNFGNPGGAVLAVVGWRAGTTKYPDGTPQSAGNGLYYSPSGKQQTFINIDEDAVGFAPQVNVGRVELGAAEGPDQNHGYVYALVQDAVLFEKGTVEGLDTPGADPLGVGVDPTSTPTYLNGVYVSSDFGKTWLRMADRKSFQNPATGSVLANLQPLGFGPGIQSWYDEWIKPDPTRHVNGIPTRIELGLEEIYENRDTQAPQNKPTDFRVTGPYFNNAACILVAAGPACALRQDNAPATTTHPDQHAGIWIPDGEGGVTMVVGNDGGVYTQHLAPLFETTTEGFGLGDNEGFHTLLPYGVAVANDGVIYAGLQDNGQIRIEPNGTQTMVFGGDGIFTQVDPKNSDVAWEMTPGGVIRATVDGGLHWYNRYPFIDNRGFYAPLMMDPLDPNHLVTGGRQIGEQTKGAGEPPSEFDPLGLLYDDEWTIGFDLGTAKHPAVAPEEDEFSGAPILEQGDIQNQVSAMDVRGKAIYAGFCGSCDPLLQKIKFHSGIATNIGGNQPPTPNTKAGWHIAAAKGLPNRLITSVRVGENDSTVYVTLGSSTLRPYVSPKGLKGYDVSDAGGFLFKSTDAGETFFDVSGNLPRVGGTWSIIRGDQLIVGSAVGAFISTGTLSSATPGKPFQFAVLGKGLPAAPVFTMQLKQDDPNTLIVATLGRGIYRYHFGASAPVKKPTQVKGVRQTRGGTLPSTGLDDLFGWVLLAVAAAVAVRMRLRRA